MTSLLLMCVLSAEPPLSLKTKEVPGSAVHEVLAERDVNASAEAVAKVITDVERFPDFMPYVKETKIVSANETGRLVYTRLTPPFVASRDFVIRDRVVQGLDTGELVTHWEVEASDVAKPDGVVRLTKNSGSWRVKPIGPNTCHVTYEFTVDPGGRLPAWIADIGNKSGVPDVFRAVERRAQKRK